MHRVTCEPNQPLVFVERTRTRPSFPSRVTYSLSYIYMTMPVATYKGVKHTLVYFHGHSSLFSLLACKVKISSSQGFTLSRSI